MRCSTSLGDEAKTLRKFITSSFGEHNRLRPAGFTVSLLESAKPLRGEMDSTPSEPSFVTFT